MKKRLITSIVGIGVIIGGYIGAMSYKSYAETQAVKKAIANFNDSYQNVGLSFDYDQINSHTNVLFHTRVIVQKPALQFALSNQPLIQADQLSVNQFQWHNQKIQNLHLTVTHLNNPQIQQAFNNLSDWIEKNQTKQQQLQQLIDQHLKQTKDLSDQTNNHDLMKSFDQLFDDHMLAARLAHQLIDPSKPKYLDLTIDYTPEKPTVIVQLKQNNHTVANSTFTLQPSIIRQVVKNNSMMSTFSQLQTMQKNSAAGLNNPEKWLQNASLTLSGKDIDYNAILKPQYIVKYETTLFNRVQHQLQNPLNSEIKQTEQPVFQTNAKPLIESLLKDKRAKVTALKNQADRQRKGTFEFHINFNADDQKLNTHFTMLSNKDHQVFAQGRLALDHLFDYVNQGSSDNNRFDSNIEINDPVFYHSALIRPLGSYLPTKITNQLPQSAQMQQATTNALLYTFDQWHFKTQGAFNIKQGQLAFKKLDLDTSLMQLHGDNHMHFAWNRPDNQQSQPEVTFQLNTDNLLPAVVAGTSNIQRLHQQPLLINALSAYQHFVNRIKVDYHNSPQGMIDFNFNISGNNDFHWQTKIADFLPDWQNIQLGQFKVNLNIPANVFNTIFPFKPDVNFDSKKWPSIKMDTDWTDHQLNHSLIIRNKAGDYLKTTNHSTTQWHPNQMQFDVETNQITFDMKYQDQIKVKTLLSLARLWAPIDINELSQQLDLKDLDFSIKANSQYNVKQSNQWPVTLTISGKNLGQLDFSLQQTVDTAASDDHGIQTTYQLLPLLIGLSPSMENFQWIKTNNVTLNTIDLFTKDQGIVNWFIQIMAQRQNQDLTSTKTQIVDQLKTNIEKLNQYQPEPLKQAIAKDDINLLTQKSLQQFVLLPLIQNGQGGMKIDLNTPINFKTLIQSLSQLSQLKMVYMDLHNRFNTLQTKQKTILQQHEKFAEKAKQSKQKHDWLDPAIINPPAVYLSNATQETLNRIKQQSNTIKQKMDQTLNQIQQLPTIELTITPLSQWPNHVN